MIQLDPAAFETGLEAMSQRVLVEARAAVVEAASLLEAKAKANAPVVTGTLRRGIKQDPVMPAGGGWETKVYPTVIYSRRVELGFHGADSLGRNYNQQGRPYFEPALVEVRAAWPGIVARHMRIAMGG